MSLVEKKKDGIGDIFLLTNSTEIMLLGGRNLTCKFTPNRRKTFIDNVRSV